MTAAETRTHRAVGHDDLDAWRGCSICSPRSTNSKTAKVGLVLLAVGVLAVGRVQLAESRVPSPAHWVSKTDAYQAALQDCTAHRAGAIVYGPTTRTTISRTSEMVVCEGGTYQEEFNVSEGG